MKKFLLGSLMLGAMAGSSFAILQIDVPVDAAGADEITGGNMYTFMNPMPWAATQVAGPDGFPLAWHVIFNYDGVATGPIDAIEVTYGADCLIAWAPAPFTVFYQPGPTFPVMWGGDAFPPCGGGEVGANELPVEFALADAYPNPFNPTTTIDFSIPEADAVTLNVFNINGQLVRTLANGQMERGTHSVTFDAASLSSGVYLYTLETTTESLTKKMVLVK